jgi:hypothetical protein
MRIHTDCPTCGGAVSYVEAGGLRRDRYLRCAAGCALVLTGSPPTLVAGVLEPVVAIPTGATLQERLRATGLPICIEAAAALRRLQLLTDAAETAAIRYRGERDRLAREREGEVWLWSGERGEDDVESLACPVLIEAEDIRRLVEAAAAWNGREAAAAAALERLQTGDY